MALNEVDNRHHGKFQETISRIIGPTTTELVELLEHQDHIMDSLQEELEVCRHQLDLFKKVERERSETEDASNALIADAEKKVTTALSAVEALQAHNANLEAEIKQLRQKLEEDRPIVTVTHLRSKIKELESMLEREENVNEGMQKQIEDMELKNEALQYNLDSGLKAKESIISSLQVKIDVLTKETVETKFKLDELQAEKEHATFKVSGELEIAQARETQMNMIVSQLTKEVSVLRSERAAMSSRIASLTQENASLRLKAVKKSINDPFSNGATEEQMQKLLADQSHLISALREESSLLTDRLEHERQEFKRSSKKIKHEKKELEDRIKKLTFS